MRSKKRFVPDSHISTNWHKPKGLDFECREGLGLPTPFHKHCGQNMRRIILYKKSILDKAIRLRRIGWFCEICHAREIADQ